MKLNVLPPNEDEKSLGRFPSWLHRKIESNTDSFQTYEIVEKYGLNTVCEEAKCPNRGECFSKKTATFLALGKACTRNCGFCDIDFTKTPNAPDPHEPDKIASSVRDLHLSHAVITMVARDDLEDGGASHMAAIVRAIREKNSNTTVELLTSDFSGKFSALHIVLHSHPEIFNHNLETVESMTPRVRHKAEYRRSLAILEEAKRHGGALFTKSGLMLGLGEEKEEVETALRHLSEANVDIVTLGQYLQANAKKLRVKSFIHPDLFAEYAEYGKKLGIRHVYAGPFVRSSYNAKLFAPGINKTIDSI